MAHHIYIFPELGLRRVRGPAGPLSGLHTGRCRLSTSCSRACSSSSSGGPDYWLPLPLLLLHPPPPSRQGPAGQWQCSPMWPAAPPTQPLVMASQGFLGEVHGHLHIIQFWFPLYCFVWLTFQFRWVYYREPHVNLNAAAPRTVAQGSYILGGFNFSVS